jgi:hypothetical protein
LVRDDVGEEGHELGAGVPRCGLAQDLDRLMIARAPTRSP